jgi:hypothetical protein
VSHGDKRDGHTATGGVMEYEFAGIAGALICGRPAFRLLRQLVCGATKAVQVHGGSCMDDFKVVWIFVKMEFVIFVSTMCTVWLCYKLSCIGG